ncbi:MAG: hypothetical protein OQJ96_05880 [Flavobacteriales bacterium]|nr:hypothetical protein [Flavobacteriales bacterium]MCW8937606.1 hypothetical protein [Flavobacteriales bacterium]MCW8968793.1 hypothetical protein [Flavobacteriales bacterium]MCW8990094.1 hypothetical protein [Flavobacteriales bacterium]MCW9019812.1 hypothetical protein [Flavobacteriales bacterium]
MVRIYFDSDVINNLRDGNKPELKELIDLHRDRLLIPYSDAHINDKLPSKEKAEELFWIDIDFITEFTKSKYLQQDEKAGCAKPFVATAREVYNGIVENEGIVNDFLDMDKMIAFLESTSKDLGIPEAADLFKSVMNEEVPNPDDSTKKILYKDQLQKTASHIQGILNDPKAYKDSRDKMWENYKLPKDASNWNENVIDNIDQHLKDKGVAESLTAMIDVSMKDKKKVNNFDYFFSSYLMLNYVGYNPDEINVKRNRGMSNHMQDAKHAFYGANCDYFVVMDKKLRKKTKALYDKFNIRTKILSPEEMVIQLNNILSNDNISEAFNVIGRSVPVDELEEDGIKKYQYRLDVRFLDYFTHLQLETGYPNDGRILLFSKPLLNYANYMFYEEFDAVVEKVNNLFGGGVNTQEVINEFRSFTDDYHIKTYVLSENVMVKLGVDTINFYLYITII